MPERQAADAYVRQTGLPSAMSMTMSPPQTASARAPRRHWVTALILGACLGLAPTIVINIPWVQSHLLTGDDRALGLALYEGPSSPRDSAGPQVTAKDRVRIERCQRYALAIYHHPIPADSVRPFPGWATPAEKAFYAACVAGPKGAGGGD